METLQEILDDFTSSIKGIYSTAVVSRHEGTALASANCDDRFETESADAFFSDVLVTMIGVQRALGADDMPEDIISTSNDICLLLRTITGTEYFWWVTTNPSSNSAFTRAMMRKVQSRIAAALP